jgi:hypothetical protein
VTFEDSIDSDFVNAGHSVGLAECLSSAELSSLSAPQNQTIDALPKGFRREKFGSGYSIGGIFSSKFRCKPVDKSLVNT